MKISEIIQRIQSLYSRGVQSDDSKLSNRHIYNKLLTVRSKLLSQEAKKKQKVSPWNYQTLSCIEIIKVQGIECPCIPPIGCEILRSKYKIPEPLSGLNGSLIQSVFSIDRQIKIDEVNINSVRYLRGNKYSKNILKYFIENGYLYLVSQIDLKLISMTALFEDPVDVQLFETYCKENCIDCVECLDYTQQDFPLDNDMIDTLIEMSVQELIVMFSQVPTDNSNNSAEDIHRTK